VLLAVPYAAGAGIGVVYVAMLPFSHRSFKRLAAEAEARRRAEAEI
jgi:CDP-diacylglycerol--serine O-phosphatidyltransferase